MNEARRESLSEKKLLARRRNDATKTLSNAAALCAVAPLREKYSFAIRLSIFLIVLTVSACDVERPRVPTEVLDVVTHVGDQIAQGRYEDIYNESSDLWKRDVTLEQSNEVFKTLQAKLGKVESRSLHSAAEQRNSSGTLKGHVFILSYETRFERGAGMETFTLIEDNGHWRLARYFVNSTALQ